MSPRPDSEVVRIGRVIVNITHPDKTLFPNDGITKRKFVEYYQRIAPTMLPHLHDRPIVMERYPDGIHGEKIFQKNAPEYYPAWIKTVSLPKKNGVVRHVVCNNAATLVYLANQAVITPHTWLSRIDKPDHPDQMIFDLDPSDGDFGLVCDVAKVLRERLAEQGLASFVKTTGSRGLHVLVPLNRRSNFDEVRAFARQVAEGLVRSDPDHLTTEVRKDKRKGRIFVDTARNAYAQTAAPAYAVRPRDGAPVAAPLQWNELDSKTLRPDLYNIRNIFDRLDKVGDPWKDLKRHAQSLPRGIGSHGS
jgi:bifunctional non-homologous end joining protein LigD